MKRIMMASIVLLMGITGEAVALGCTSSANRMNKTQLANFFSGRTIHAVAPDSEDWKEDHCASRDLYRVGDGTAADPRAKEGTWSITGRTTTSGFILYNYISGNSQLSYQWTVYADDPNAPTLVYFCNGTIEIAHSYYIGGPGSAGC
jgi:hypothetical protein